MRSNPYITRCTACGANTSKAYARLHAGQCKACTTGEPAKTSDRPSRQERILEHGYQAYAIEEGHYND